MRVPRSIAFAGTWALALTLIAGCGGKKEATDSTAKKIVTIGDRDVATAEVVTMQSGVTISGTLEPFRFAEVKAQVGGTISGVRIDAGSTVGRGQVLGTVIAEGVRSMASSAQASVAAAEANVALARQRLESLQNLYQSGAVSKIEVDNARTGVEAAQAQLSMARANAAGAGEQASRAVVRSPLSGTVSARFVNDGEAVNSGQKLFTVVNHSILELAGKIPATERGRVHPGQEVALRLSANPEHVVRGRVARIEPVADLQTRQVGVHVEIDNPGGTIVAGQYATGTILSTSSSGSATVIPSAAIHRDARGDHVYVVVGSRVERRSVTTGTRDEQKGIVAITQGMKPGDIVLTTPTVDIAPEAEVRLVRTSNAATAPSGEGRD